MLQLLIMDTVVMMRIATASGGTVPMELRRLNATCRSSILRATEKFAFELDVAVSQSGKMPSELRWEIHKNGGVEAFFL
jgi:hypothetical protein